jgi:hypothetical protein
VNIKLLEKAKEMAYAAYNPPAHNGRCIHYSFIVYKSRIILFDCNKPQTHSINLFNPKIVRGVDVTDFKGLCSECSVFLRLKNMTNIPYHKCSLINIRIKRTGEIGLSRPCSSCSSLLRVANFKEVVYTDDNGKWVLF